MRVTTTIAGLLACATVLGTGKLRAQIQDVSDFIHPRLANGVRSLGARLLTAKRRVFLFVNHELAEPARVRKLLAHWAGKDRKLPPAVVDALSDANEPSLLHEVLWAVSRRFLEVADCRQVIPVDDVPNLGSQLNDPEAILISVDARCRGDRKEHALLLDLELRIHRLSFEARSRRITKAALIYRDRAGSEIDLEGIPWEPHPRETRPERKLRKPDAKIPGPTGTEIQQPVETGPPEPAVSYRRPLRKQLERAVVQALSQRIGHSLWANPRIVGSPWLGATARTDGARFLDASMHRKARQQNGGGR
ncbi:MAG: hypothetical protein ACE5F1_04305 [Planctomycetota bacterium]